MRRLASVVLALVLVATTTAASAQSIGIYFDQAATICGATVPFGPGQLYVIARLDGVFAAGLQGAEFRIEGMPAGYFTSWIPGPGCPCIPEPIGDPFTTGVNLAYATCQTGSGGLVVLGQITFFASTTPSNVYVRVRQHATPSSPLFPCPLLVTCTPPVFSAACVAGGEAIINGPPCTVGLEPGSWSQVKALYD